MARVARQAYQHLIQNGHKIYTGAYVIYIDDQATWKNHCLIKCAAKKKLGKAFERNYAKRRLKAALQSLKLKNSVFLLAIVLRSQQTSFHELKEHLRKHLSPYIENHSS